MKLKKLISVMLIGACVCSMAACGSKKEEKKIESADDLKDAKIGVQTGTTGDIYCSDDFGDDHVERFNKGADAVQALVKGKINAVVIDNEPAKAFVDANDGLKILETPYVEEDYAMCFKKGNTELEDKFNAAIKELKEDGTFDKIVGYYIAEIILYGNFIAPISSVPGNVVQIAVAAVVVLIVIEPIEIAVKKIGITQFA